MYPVQCVNFRCALLPTSLSSYPLLSVICSPIFVSPVGNQFSTESHREFRHSWYTLAATYPKKQQFSLSFWDLAIILWLNGANSHPSSLMPYQHYLTTYYVIHIIQLSLFYKWRQAGLDRVLQLIFFSVFLN